MGLVTNALRREASREESGQGANGNSRLSATISPAAATADRFRRLSIWLLLASALIALVMTLALEVRVDPKGTSILECLIAALLLASRMWWNRTGHVRMGIDLVAGFMVWGLWFVLSRQIERKAAKRASLAPA